MILFIFLFSNTYGQEEELYSLKTVVIDAGHGGLDDGTSGKLSKEKDIALAISLKVGNLIKENIPGINIIYTRDSDVFIPLNERADIANRNNADLFISIHCNGNSNINASGTETYAMGLHKSEGNLEVAKKENAAILYEEDYSTKYEGFDPNSTESYIIFTFLQNTFLQQSLNYASFVQDQFETRAQRKNRGVKQAGFLVLWKTTMPSVLIEVGFLTNPKEELYLVSNEGQDYIASAIYRAFKDYKKAIEEKSHFATKRDLPVDIEKEEIIKNSTDAPVQFKVQVASARNPIDTASSYFKGITGIEENKFDTIYKYTIGTSSDYNKMVEIKKSISDKFPDAFIIAIEKNGQQISLSEAFKLLNN
ncbi:MAG: N-acetylmuramoyl-L-alanine amidase [Bacteroidales bacterium]